MIQKAALRVLLVEDDPDHAYLARNAILSSRKREYVVELASTVEDAMKKVQESAVHMVLCDIHLPDKTGVDFLEWLNAQEIDIPVVMMTGTGDEKMAVRALQDGAYNYIVKDESYLRVLPHVLDEAFIKHLADQEKERYEREIREKNAALEKANRELKKLDQLKSDFIASVSHDLRTPLNSVQESIALILEGVVNANDEKGKNVLQIAKRSIARLEVMINDLLDFSKIEAGKMRLHLEPCDIQILVDEVLGSLRSLAEKKKLRLKFTPIEGFPKVVCDAERMIQVFTNLVGNAIKFTPEHGIVTVTVEQASRYEVHVTFSDTGIGIPQESLEKIFERFEQVRGTSPQMVKGTGLGLAICKELAKLHGGDVWAESELGKGSRFIVCLPLTQDFRGQMTQHAQEARLT